MSPGTRVHAGEPVSACRGRASRDLKPIPHWVAPQADPGPGMLRPGPIRPPNPPAATQDPSMGSVTCTDSAGSADSSSAPRATTQLPTSMSSTEPSTVAVKTVSSVQDTATCPVDSLRTCAVDPSRATTSPLAPGKPRPPAPGSDPPGTGAAPPCGCDWTAGTEASVPSPSEPHPVSAAARRGTAATPERRRRPVEVLIMVAPEVRREGNV